MPVDLTLLDAGYCTHPEHVVLQNGKWSNMRFPAMFGLLQHPERGPILFDTGYSQEFHRATRRFPYSLYARITPVYVREEDTAVAKLHALGIRPTDIGHIIISHFHGDHITALRDFPRARFIYFDAAYEAVRHRRGLRALRAAFLPDLMPPDFDARAVPLRPGTIRLPPECAPFERGADVFGDGSLIAVELPGHADGQMGLFLRTRSGEPYFLVGDACFTSSHYRDLKFPHPVAKLFTSNWTEYRKTIEQLHDLHLREPGIQIVPSHCSEAYARHIVARNPAPMGDLAHGAAGGASRLDGASA